MSASVVFDLNSVSIIFIFFVYSSAFVSVTIRMQHVTLSLKVLIYADTMLITKEGAWRSNYGGSRRTTRKRWWWSGKKKQKGSTMYLRTIRGDQLLAVTPDKWQVVW